MTEIEKKFITENNSEIIELSDELSSLKEAFSSVNYLLVKQSEVIAETEKIIENSTVNNEIAVDDIKQAKLLSSSGNKKLFYALTISGFLTVGILSPIIIGLKGLTFTGLSVLGISSLILSKVIN